MYDSKHSIVYLCELLDERNVEYGWDTNTVYWNGNDGVPWTADLYFGSNLSLFSPRCTPEQVIEATLGRGTCHNTQTDFDFQCSECGTCLDNGRTLGIRYCPKCGRKVVD